MTDGSAASVDQDIFVLWPEGDDPEWTDAEQGGLFAYLVYRTIGNHDRAHVDVNAHLHAPRMPLLTAIAEQLWARPVIGAPVPADQLWSALPWSAPMQAAIYLGASPRSSVRTGDGEPFQVTTERLTMTGQAIEHALNHEYGFGGDLLTFAGLPQKHPRWRWRS